MPKQKPNEQVQQIPLSEIRPFKNHPFKVTDDELMQQTIDSIMQVGVLNPAITGITQNVKDLLSSREVENIFENSDYVYMLNQASGDRQILAKQLNISPHQLSYVTQSAEGEGLLFYGSVILPFVDRFPKDTELYKIITTKLSEQVQSE